MKLVDSWVGSRSGHPASVPARFGTAEPWPAAQAAPPAPTKSKMKMSKKGFFLPSGESHVVVGTEKGEPRGACWNI